MIETIFLVTALLSLGIYNWILIDKVADLEEQCKTYHDLTISMSTELQALGSPNVRVYEGKTAKAT